MTEFAAGLRKLRAAAGGRPYRELSRRAHYSSTTLSDAAGGKRLPTLAVAVAYVRACDGDVEEWTRRWHEVARDLAAVEDRGDEERADDGRAPYAGLSTYQVGDAEWFHGRERLIDELVTKVGECRFVAVVGPSGAGKSSLLRAGLLPRLATTGALVALFTPGARPIEECAIQLARFLDRTPGSLVAELATERGLHLLTRQAVTAEREDTEVVLVVDQFEEVFTLCRDTEERTRFIAALVEASRAHSSRCRIVLGVRADFYAHCLLDADLATVFNDSQVTVGPMTVDELRHVIVRPARLAGCTVESALVARLLTHAHGRAGALPLLSHALLETWRRRSGATLTLTGFERAGGIEGALSKTAEAVYGALDQRQQLSARLLFLRLVALGEGTRDTKRRVSNDELDADTTTILAAFADARLIMLTEHGTEITHEALIESWPRLQSWLIGDREGQRIHRQLTEATATWQHHHRDPSTLLRGTRLAVAKDWSRQRPGAANQAEATFLDASATADERERAAVRRRTTILRGLVALLGVLLVVATTAAIQAVRAQQAATQQRNVAVAVNAVRTAGNLASTDPVLAAQISLAAYRLHPSPETKTSLITHVAAATAMPLPAHEARGSIAPDGRLVADAWSDLDETTLSVVAGSRLTQVATIHGGGYPAQFSPDSRKMLTVDRNWTPILWDVSDPVRPVRQASIPTTSPFSTFSPDSKMLLTTDASAELVNSSGGAPDSWTVGATSRIWDISDAENPRQLAPLPDSTVAVAVFAATRPVLATISLGNQFLPQATLMLWDIDTPTQPRLVRSVDLKPRIQPLAAQFSRDDRILYIADSGGDLTVWNVETLADPKRLASIAASNDMLTGVTSSPDDRRLVTSDAGGVLTIWDISASPNPKQVIATRHTGTQFGLIAFAERSDAFQALTYRESAGSATSLTRWQLDPDLAAAALCKKAGPYMSKKEWGKYFPVVPYRPLCA